MAQESFLDIRARKRRDIHTPKMFAEFWDNHPELKDMPKREDILNLYFDYTAMDYEPAFVLQLIGVEYERKILTDGGDLFFLNCKGIPKQLPDFIKIAVLEKGFVAQELKKPRIVRRLSDFDICVDNHRTKEGHNLRLKNQEKTEKDKKRKKSPPKGMVFCDEVEFQAAIKGADKINMPDLKEKHYIKDGDLIGKIICRKTYEEYLLRTKE